MQRVLCSTRSNEPPSTHTNRCISSTPCATMGRRDKESDSEEEDRRRRKERKKEKERREEDVRWRL